MWSQYSIMSVHITLNIITCCPLFRCLVKPVIDRVKECRLTADDFEVLEVIGRGAFGEVKVHTYK